MSNFSSVNTCQFYSASHISFLSVETDLKLLPDLCQLLESVCTARDFLLEIGGKPEKSLVEFMVIANSISICCE